MVSLRRFLDELHKGVAQAERKYGVEGNVDRSSEAGGPWSYLGYIISLKYKRGGFMTAVVYGNQGAGKSVYTIKVARDAFQRLGINVDYKTIIKQYMAFLADDIIRLIRRGSWQNRIPVIIWDDAGVHGDATLFRLDPVMAKLLADVFRTARTRVSGVLMSTPDSDDILRRIRAGTDKYIVYIVEADDVWSIAHIYVTKKLPSGKTLIYKVAEEEFKRHLPVYDFYLQYRDRYAEEALEKLEERLQEIMLEKMVRRAKLLQALEKLRGRQEAGETEEDIDIEIIPPE